MKNKYRASGKILSEIDFIILKHLGSKNLTNKF